jgi:hypothetical protein
VKIFSVILKRKFSVLVYSFLGGESPEFNNHRISHSEYVHKIVKFIRIDLPQSLPATTKALLSDSDDK